MLPLCVCVCVCVLGKPCPGVWIHESSAGVLGHSLLPHLHPASPTVLPTRTSSLQSLHLGLERSMSCSGPPAGGISLGTQPPPVPFYRPVSSQAPDVVSTHFLLRDGLWTARWEGLGKRHSAGWVIIFRTWYPKGRTVDPWQFRMSIIIMRNFLYPQLTFLKTELDHLRTKREQTAHSSPCCTRVQSLPASISQQQWTLRGFRDEKTGWSTLYFGKTVPLDSYIDLKKNFYEPRFLYLHIYRKALKSLTEISVPLD